MRQNLVAELLVTFSTSERKAFRHFLARPERNIRTDVQKLGTFLLQGLGVSAEAAHRKLFPKTSFDRQKINQLGSWLYAEARAFLLEKNQATSADEIALIQEFDRRKLPRHRDRLIRRLRKQNLAPAAAHALEQAVYNTTHRRSRTTDTNLQQVSDLLDRTFIRRKLHQVCLMQSHENVSRIGYDKGLLDAVLAYVEAQNLQQQIDIGAYYHAYRFLHDPEAREAFARFQSILPQLPEWLKGEERRDLYLLGINFCIRQTNRGDEVMAREALRLYREGLSNGALLENGRLTAFTYRNAVALSLKIRDFTWAEDFIGRYADYLPRDQRDNLVHYNRARLAYARGATATALEELRFVSSPDTLFTLTLETLRAKIYYETKALDLLDSHLDKMRIFLRRRGNSYHHRNYANFIAFLSRILHLRPRPEERRQLTQNIAEEAILTERKWLLAQLEKG